MNRFIFCLLQVLKTNIYTSDKFYSKFILVDNRMFIINSFKYVLVVYKTVFFVYTLQIFLISLGTKLSL